MSAWTKAMLEPFSSALKAQPPAPAANNDHQSTEQLEQAMRDLQAQVAELRESSRKPRRGGKTSRKRK